MVVYKLTTTKTKLNDRDYQSLIDFYEDKCVYQLDLETNRSLFVNHEDNLALKYKFEI